MVTKTSNFKIIFIAVFIVAAIAGVLSFAGIIKLGGSSQQKISGVATVWGTINQQSLSKFFAAVNVTNPDIQVVYIQKDESTFEKDIIEAVASAQVPDLIILPDNLSYRFSSKLMHIPFASLPAQTFGTNYISASNIFAVNDGYLAVPFVADPLVMYFNQDLLAAVGISQAPKDWPAFSSSVSLLTKKTSDLTIVQSATALGTYKNINNAKDILALLFMQGGNNLVLKNPDGTLNPRFGATAGNQETSAAKNALNFYLGFSNPVNDSYSWNDGLPRDRDSFVRGTLVYYFGHASELPIIRAQNPNLNFSIGLPPQFKNAKVPLTTGTMYGLSIPAIAKDKTLSVTVAKMLTTKENEQLLVSSGGSQFSYVPGRRDVIAEKPVGDPYMTLLYNVALVMRTWLDPHPTSSNQIFRDLVYTISSGVSTVDIALLDAGGKMQALSSF